ncbi:MAG: HAMP domain-containing protein [Anaerolineae bacterium]|nr:HAMP domain-containing protein [Anaerolineae bacterium]
MKPLIKTGAAHSHYHGFKNWITELRAQAILLTILLLSLMLILTVGVTFLAYQQISQSLAESRDQELASVSAERLSESIEAFVRGLRTLANQTEMQSGEPTLQQGTLERGRDLVADFTTDGGIIILNARGFVSVTEPFRPDLIGQDFSQEPYFKDARTLRTSTFSDIIKEPGSGEDIIVIAVPIEKPDSQFMGVIAGRFYLSFQRLGQEIQKLRVGEEGTAYLVDRRGRLIYHPISRLIGTDFSSREAVQRLQQGTLIGAVTSHENGQPSTVEGYAVVQVTGWGLVIGEPWAQVVEPAQNALKPIAVVLIVGLITVAAFVSLGVQAVTDPIQNLVIQTRQVTAGDYDAKVTLSRIKEIRELGMAFNEMVEQIRKYRAGVRQYVADITQSQEEERKRIARELHDDTVQSLIAIGQRIELIKGMLDDPIEARTRLSELRTMVTGAIASVRQFSRDLRPLALEDLGLVAAMQYLVNQLTQSEGVDVDFRVEGTPDGLPADMEVAIYRILQEALNNVKRHAHATEVNVLAQFTEKQIMLTVEDDGCGFTVPDSITDFASSGSFGMMGLQERAHLFGGNIEVESQLDEGTIVRLIIPRRSDLSPFEIRNNFSLKDSQVSEDSLLAEKIS